MKKVFIIVSFVFSVSLTFDASGAPTSGQVEKLVAAAWKELPRSIDVTYYRTLKDNTKTEQHFRKIYEEGADQMHGPKEQLSPNELARRERNIQMNVDIQLAAWQDGHKVKRRICYDGERFRIDWVFGNPATTYVDEGGQKKFRPEKKLGPNTPFETTSIDITDTDGGYLRYSISHADNKSVTIRKVKGISTFDNSRLMSFTRIPSSMFLQIKLGKKQNGSYEPDETKIAKLKLGALESINIDIQPDKDAPETRDKIKVEFINPSNQTTMIFTMICSRKDYSIVYNCEFRNLSTGQLVLERRADNFDSQGFPHNFIEIQYDNSGQVKFSEEFRIESVSLNTPIPSEVFDFTPPADYKVTDYRKTPDEQKSADIEYFKGWLKDENWTRRYRALTRLKELLKENPDQFKEIATSMLNDKQPQVRMTAESILKSLESNQ